MQELGLPNTLLGVDLIRNQSVVASDVTGAELEQWVAQAQAQEQPVYLVLTLIGGQGHVFGRGNQQLTPAVIRAVGRERFVVVKKIKKLNKRTPTGAEVKCGLTDV